MRYKLVVIDGELQEVEVTDLEFWEDFGKVVRSMNGKKGKRKGMSFQVGQKVVCVDPHYNHLKAGEVYTIKKVEPEGDMVHLEGVEYGWFTDRFEPVKEEA